MKHAFRLITAVALAALVAPALAQDAEAGAEVYQNFCVTCHGAEGEGGLGPAHAGNQNLADTEHVVDIILHGEGEMPAFAGQLSDQQIADVSTYIRTSWGNDFGAVEPQMVAQQREGGQEGAEGEGDAAQTEGEQTEDAQAEGEQTEGEEAEGEQQTEGEGEQAEADDGQAPAAVGATVALGNGMALETVAAGLNSPVHLTSPPDDDRRFVVDRAGYIYILGADGTMLETPFLDLTDRIVELREQFDERGLLGLAFHPNFAENGRFYVYYSAPLREEAPDNWDHTARISEFMTVVPEEEGAARGSTDQADPNSERILLRVDQPQFNHNAGAVAFGPDGYLYIALGDGGAANDVALGHPPMGHGQDITSMLGNILRIDVDRGWPGYAVPQDNPFVGTEGVDETYAWGWRNPWRMSFDRAGEHGLFVATNGQNLWEAVYLVEEPGNYGWNILEGTHCFDPQTPNETPSRDACAETGAQGEPLRLPVIEYPHPANQGDSAVAGTSVIGGYLYRGEALPDLQGRYVFGDWSTSFTQPGGQVLVATPTEAEGELWSLEQMGQIGAFVLGFGEDAQGELYVMTTQNAGPTGDTGAVHKLVPAGSDGGANGDAADETTDEADGD